MTLTITELAILGDEEFQNLINLEVKVPPLSFS